MAKKSSVQKERKIGKQARPEKNKIDPKQKNTIWTIVIIIVLTIFFIINNTRDEPEEGPYPPNYVPKTSTQSQ